MCEYSFEYNTRKLSFQAGYSGRSTKETMIPGKNQHEVEKEAQISV